MVGKCYPRLVAEQRKTNGQRPCFTIRTIHGFKRRLHSQFFFDDLEFYLGQTLSLYEAKCLGKYLTQIFTFTMGQNLAIIKIQIGGAAAYQLVNTSSHTITEVKQRWARLVLG